MSLRPAPRIRASAALYRFRESLFALAALIVAAGVGFAELTAYLDQIALADEVGPWVVEMNSSGAAWLLSTVAGATITTAGVVFSLTVVSLQLASSSPSCDLPRGAEVQRRSPISAGPNHALRASGRDDCAAPRRGWVEDPLPKRRLRLI